MMNQTYSTKVYRLANDAPKPGPTPIVTNEEQGEENRFVHPSYQ